MSDAEKNELVRRSIKERVLRRASDDEDFRLLLIDNPKSAIARELGIDIPDNLHVSVIREAADQVFIVLPWNPDDFDGQIVSGLERLVFGMGVGYEKG